MPPTLLLIIDVILALGVTIRLTRAITVEDIGGRLLRDPAERWVQRAAFQPGGVVNPSAPDALARFRAQIRLHKRRWWADALSCPFCVSVHVAWLTLLVLVLVGGPGGDGALLAIWRILAAACTFSYISAHIMVALGDVSEHEDDLEEDPEPVRSAEQ